MKKILFISVFMILSAVGMAQLTGTYLKVYSKTTPVARSLPDSTVIFVKNQAAFYMTTHAMTATQTVQYMIDSSFILTIASGTSSATIADMSVTSVTASTATVSTLTVTGSHTVTGYLNPQGPFYADSSLYFGCDYSNTWMRFFYQQVGIPRSRGVIENMADYYIQAKNGLSQVLAIQRDTTLTESGVNHLNVVKQVYLGKDTTGIGSTANIGTTLYYNGHFYGLIESTPPSWKQLDN